MEGKLKECMKPHMLAHSLAGFGLGVAAVNAVNTLYGEMGLWVGIGLFVLGFVWDYTVNK